MECVNFCCVRVGSTNQIVECKLQNFQFLVHLLCILAWAWTVWNQFYVRRLSDLERDYSMPRKRWVWTACTAFMCVVVSNPNHVLKQLLWWCWHAAISWGKLHHTLCPAFVLHAMIESKEWERLGTSLETRLTPSHGCDVRIDISSGVRQMRTAVVLLIWEFCW